MKRMPAFMDTNDSDSSERKGFNPKLLLLVPATLVLGASAFFIVRRKLSFYEK
jgi:hypothetical protein